MKNLYAAFYCLIFLITGCNSGSDSGIFDGNWSGQVSWESTLCEPDPDGSESDYVPQLEYLLDNPTQNHFIQSGNSTGDFVELHDGAAIFAGTHVSDTEFRVDFDSSSTTNYSGPKTITYTSKSSTTADVKLIWDFRAPGFYGCRYIYGGTYQRID